MPDAALLESARQLFEAGRYWDCHEELEPAWLAANGVERDFLSGLILLAATLHKARAQASPRGARRNFAKALKHLALVPDVYGGIEVRVLEARVHEAIADAALAPKFPLTLSRSSAAPSPGKPGLNA